MQPTVTNRSYGVLGPYILRPIWALARLTLVVAVIATSATLLARVHWLCDLAANLRVQQCIVLFPALGFCILVKQWRWVAIASLCILVHVPWFIPSPVFKKRIGPTDRSLTVTVANVLTSNHRHKDVIVDVLRAKPDVFVILELSSALAAKLRDEVLANYPHVIARPMDNGNFGIGLYSRHPIIESEVFALNTDIESIDSTIDIRGKVYRMIATHPLPPMDERGFQMRNEHLKQLAERIGAVNSRAAPTILVGDLNATPWSPYFRQFEESTRLRRATERFNLTPTWYRFDTFPCGLILDHALISETLVCKKHRVGPDIGSDHRSVTVTIAHLTR